MPNFNNCTIRQKPNGVYEIRYRQNGYNKSFSSKSKTKALQKYKEFIKGLKAITKKEESKLFKNYADTYLYEQKKPFISKAYFESIEYVYKKEFPRFNNKEIDTITVKELQEYFNAILDEGKGRKSEKVKSELYNIFELAKIDNVIKINPIDKIIIPKHKRKVGTALTIQEEINFLELIKGHRFEFIYKFLLYSGTRGSEAVKVKQRDINYTDNTITIINSKEKGIREEKERTTRKLPLFPKLLKLLQETPKEKQIFNVSQKEISTEFTKLTQTHQLRHLRHTFASRARTCEISQEIVAIWLNHTFNGANTTSKVYTHFDNDYMQKQALKLNY